MRVWKHLSPNMSLRVNAGSTPVRGRKKKVSIMKKNNLTLINATRNSSHIGSRCDLLIRRAELGKDYGIINLMFYTEHGYKDLYVIRVLYHDNMQYGDVVVGIKKTNNILRCEHISGREGHSWAMDFKE